MHAVHELTKGDVMIVVGTSSVVYPAASLPEQARNRGATLIEINPDESTPLTGLVNVYLRGTAAEVLPKLVDAVLGPSEELDGQQVEIISNRL
jgi:NAD-dependent deacetylase